jgi:hypothetical protein
MNNSTDNNPIKTLKKIIKLNPVHLEKYSCFYSLLPYCLLPIACCLKQIS